jgi:hypothetical protein
MTHGVALPAPRSSAHRSPTTQPHRCTIASAGRSRQRTSDRVRSAAPGARSSCTRLRASRSRRRERRYVVACGRARGVPAARLAGAGAIGWPKASRVVRSGAGKGPKGTMGSDQGARGPCRSCSSRGRCRADCQPTIRRTVRVGSTATPKRTNHSLAFVDEDACTNKPTRSSPVSGGLKSPHVARHGRRLATSLRTPRSRTLTTAAAAGRTNDVRKLV